MNAAQEFVAELARHGASLKFEGDRLRLVPRPGAKLSEDQIAKARSLKAALLNLVRARRSEQRQFETAEIDHALFDERAGISEYDGGLSRNHAEQLAALQAMPLPVGVSEKQRWTMVQAAAIFLDRHCRALGNGE
jgi:hypothetical protein